MAETSEKADFDLTAKTEQEVPAVEADFVLENVKIESEEQVNDDSDFIDLTAQPETKEDVKEEVVAETPDIKTEEVVSQETQPNKEGSLTEEVVTEPVQQELQVTDDVVTKYLSEKLDREFVITELTNPVEQKNPLEEDPYLKELYEWRERTGRPIEDWVKFQQNFDDLDDVAVARKFLQNEYNSLNDEEIDLELSQFVPTELDDEKETKMKNLEMKKLAIKGRNFLSGLKSNLNTPSENTLTPEIKQNLDLLQEIKTNHAKSQEAVTAYNKSISEVSSKFDSFPIKLSDDLEISFNLSAGDKTALPKFIDGMSHWKNEDGSWNHQAVVADGALIAHKDAIFKSIFDQGVAAGKNTIEKEVKNITIDKPQEVLQGNNTSGIKVEGLNDFFGGRKLQVGRKR